MFLHLSVILFTGVGVSGRHPAPRQTPSSRHPPQRRPLQTDTETDADREHFRSHFLDPILRRPPHQMSVQWLGGDRVYLPLILPPPPGYTCPVPGYLPVDTPPGCTYTLDTYPWVQLTSPPRDLVSEIPTPPPLPCQ